MINKIKNVIVLIVVMFLVSPAFAIQESVVPDTVLKESYYSGESFFKTPLQLQQEREEEIRKQALEHNRQFLPNGSGLQSTLSSRKVTPPITKFRRKVVRMHDNHKVNKANKKHKFADANGVVLDEEENEVLKQEQEDEAQAVMKCKVMKYNPDKTQVDAVGGVEITFPKQNVVLTSDRMIFHQDTNIIELFDNVKVVKAGNEVTGDYLKVNLNEESGMLDNLKASQYMFDIQAEHGYMFGDDILTTNGKITSSYDKIVAMYSSGFGNDVRNLILPENEMEFLFTDIKENKMYVKVKELNISAKKSHDKVQVKGLKVYSKTGKKLVTLPSMTFYTNKEHDYFEGNYPELGSFPNFGMFLGPGVVLETPFGSTLKLIPTVNMNGNLGFGGVARFKSGTNQTDFAYSSSKNTYYLKGYQRLDENVMLQYGANSYMDEWFLGGSWLGYGGEALYEKGYTHQDFLYPKGNLSFRHRVSGGFFHENDRKKDHNKYDNVTGDFSTLRFKYMAQLDQTLLSLGKLYNRDDHSMTKEDLKYLTLNLVGEGSAAVYGTGDTQFIGRIGPRLTTQYKLWRQDIGYYLSAYDDHTPFITMDAYRYGRSNVYLREYLRLHKYLTLGFYGSYKLSNDLDYDYQADKTSALREATFYVSLGPDDFKLNLGYDFVRENTYFGVSMAMNTKGTKVDYERMQIKNGDQLGKTDDELLERKVYTFVAPANPNKTKAVVTPLQDKSTYMQGEHI